MLLKKQGKLLLLKDHEGTLIKEKKMYINGAILNKSMLFFTVHLITLHTLLNFAAFLQIKVLWWNDGEVIIIYFDNTVNNDHWMLTISPVSINC